MASVTDQSSQQVSSDGDWPSPRAAWTALVLLMLGIFLSCIDRGIINLLVEPIKAEFGLTDTQFGALQSLAFGLFYTTMAIPLGVLGDRYQRRYVIAAGIAIFNVFAIMTGLARTYGQLFLARVGVGFGEASLTPSAFSMISDYFPPRKLGRAMSFYLMSNYVGASSAFVVGGLLFAWFEKIHAANPATLMGVVPWQATVMAVAVPGLLLFPCFLLLREPPRRGLVGATQKLPLRTLLAELGKRRNVLLLLIAGGAMINLQSQAVNMWIPALFIRLYGWSATEIGFWLGMLLLGGSVLGAFLGGWATDWMTARGKPDGPIVLAVVSFAGAGLFGALAPLAPSPVLALVCFIPPFLLKPVALGVIPVALQVITPNQLRAQVSATYLTIISLVGLAVGPVVVGAMSDYLFGGGTGLRYAMALITAVGMPVMVIVMLLARRPFRQIHEASI